MCTVSLRCDSEFLLLTMNRDERYDRAPEQEPRRIPGEPGRASWIAPFDSASGGTWIGVNDRGVASCLLNGYEPADEALRGVTSVPSRGSIIPRILESQDGSGAAVLPAVLDFSVYPSFTLLVASRHGGEVVRWRRGGDLRREPVGPGWTLLTSSSYREPEVASWRRLAFDAWREAGESYEHGLPDWQIAAQPGDETQSPFMTRAQSGTRSVTQVRVDAALARVTLAWWPRRQAQPIDPSVPAALLTLPLMSPDQALAESPR